MASSAATGTFVRATSLEDLRAAGRLVVHVDGHTLALHTDGTAKAKLTDRGLFVAGARRVRFMPLDDLLRRLGG